MDFGLAVANEAKPDLLTSIARKGEDLGFDHFLVTDHYMLPEGRNSLLETWTFLAGLAKETEEIRLGTCVTPLTLRPPSVLAKVVATVDHLSEGRVILGAGVGWHRPEFEGFSTWLETPERVRASREALELIKKLWTEDEVTYDGEFVEADGALVKPKPVQDPHPEIWMGTHSPYTMKLTGWLGNGWIPIGPRWLGGAFDAGEYGEGVKRIQRAARSRDREGDFKAFSCLMGPGETSDLVGDIERFRGQGMNSLTLGFSDPQRENLEFLEKFRDEVVSVF